MTYSTCTLITFAILLENSAAFWRQTPLNGPLFIHRTVLLDEAVAALAIRPEGVYVDCTFGRGGHSRKILAALGPQGRLIAFDKDPEAIAEAEKRRMEII